MLQPTTEVKIAVLGSLLLVSSLSAPAWGIQAEINVTSVSQVQVSELAQPARSFEEITSQLPVTPINLAAGQEPTFSCRGFTSLGAGGRGGVRYVADGVSTTFDEFGQSQDFQFGPVKGRTDRGGFFVEDLTVLEPASALYGADSASGIVNIKLKGKKGINRFEVSCSLGTRTPCEEDDHHLCLGGKKSRQRFRFYGSYYDNNQGWREAYVTTGSDSKGYLSFGTPGRMDVEITIYDKCKVNGHYWVGYDAGSGNREFYFYARDTLDGLTRSYGNVMGRDYTDVAAFPGCP
jgi:hypothetical protein